MSHTIHQGKAEEKGVEARPFFSLRLKENLKEAISFDSCLVNDGSSVVEKLKDVLPGENGGKMVHEASH